MAIATVALAGVLFGVRGRRSIPFSGPENLIFAFEAVVIGGLGSLWGTLAGGITLGVAQLIGNQINPQWGAARRPRRVPRRARRSGPPGMFGKVQPLR